MIIFLAIAGAVVSLPTAALFAALKAGRNDPWAN